MNMVNLLSLKFRKQNKVTFFSLILASDRSNQSNQTDTRPLQRTYKKYSNTRVDFWKNFTSSEKC